MVRKMFSVQIAVLSCLLVVNTANATIEGVERAPQQGKKAQKTISEDNLKKEGTNCFDYYKFNSVQVSVGLNASSYKENQIVEFSGSVENQNSYPVVDGNVLVRISKKNKDFKNHGNLVVDEFYATKSSITLNAGEKKDLKFDWSVPVGISAGEYQVDYFFTVGKRFNLGGLPFSYEVSVGNSNFTINSENKGSVEFDPSQTKVNGKSYNQVGSSLVVEPNSKVVIEQVLVNSTDKDQDVSLTQELYYWDGLRKEDLRTSRKTNVKVSAGKSKKVSFEISEVKDSVSFVKMIAKQGNQKSITWVRLASNINSPRINYPAITKFPLKKGQKAELFSCFHNTSGLNKSGKFTLTLTDKSGKVITSETYTGMISPNMSAIAKEFKANKNLDYLKINAVLTDDKGQKVDEYSAVYDCKKIDGCSIGGGNSIINKIGHKEFTFPVIVLGGIGLSFLGVFLVFAVRSKKRKK